MDKIKLRQICFIYAALLPATRMLLYPATLAYHAGNDLLFSALGNLLAEGAVIFAVMMLAKRTRLTFFGLLKNTFGEVAARIVYGAFALFFAASALLPLLEQKGFVTQVLYENAPSVLSFAPFFALSLFACMRGLKSIGRIADIALPLFAVCFAVLILLALPQADFAALLPLFGRGAAPVLRGWQYGIARYTDCLFPLFFLGHFRTEKGGTAKVMLSFAAGALATLLFLAVFYAVFADIAPLQQNALAQIAKYTTAFTSLGRIDLLPAIALSLVLAFALCIPLQLSTHCACTAIGCRPLWPALAVNGALLALTIFFNYSFREVQAAFAEVLWPVFGVFCYLVPLLALLLRREKRRPDDE